MNKSNLLEIELPSGTIHVGRFGMNFNGRFWWQARVTPIECSKRVDSCVHLLLEGLVEAFGELICLRVVWGCKHMHDT